MTSTIFTMTSNGADNLSNSIITTEFAESIYLGENSRHVLGLVNLSTFNSIPNIDESNNVLRFTVVNVKHLSGKKPPYPKSIKLRKGAYQLSDIESEIREGLRREMFPYIIEKLRNEEIFSLRPIESRNAVVVRSSCLFLLTNGPSNILTNLLGFALSPNALSPDVPHESTQGVEISGIRTINIHCDVTKNSYHNGHRSHIIYSFPINVLPGFAIQEIPKNIIYLPIQYDYIKSITICAKDQDGKLIDFRGEKISLTLEMKKLL